MKLETTLKERPGFLHMLPLFDLFALAGMLLILGPMFLNESGISVKVPSSSFQLQRYTRSLVVTLGPSDESALLYLGRDGMSMKQLAERLRELKEEKGTADALVLLKSDETTSVGMERLVTETILAEGYSLALVGETAQKEKSPQKTLKNKP